MTLINIFIFLIPFMLVFSVKPEDSMTAKRVSLFFAVLSFWIALPLAAYLRYEDLWAAWHADDTHNIEDISNLTAYDQYAKFWWHYTALGWLYGITVTFWADFIWRRTYRTA
jgi:hypothetical protein